MVSYDPLAEPRIVTIDEALRAASRRLSPRSSTPRLDAEVLLGEVLQLSRAGLLARATASLTQKDADRFLALVARREQGEPVAYLTGHKEFFGLDLEITEDVLVPRPETESVVEACLEAIAPGATSQLADIGTGSGAIAVAVATSRPNVHVFATDVSEEALAVAKRNCERHGIADRVSILLGNLLDPLPGPVDVIAANLPYVSQGEASPDVATWEPRVAVFGGGEDGTLLIREFLQAAPRYLLPGGTVVMETSYSQGPVVSDLAGAAFPSAVVGVRKDLAGYDRIVIIKTP